MQAQALDEDIGDRHALLCRLEEEHGVCGAEVYLLDLIPLIEMAWARCPPAPQERRLIYEYALQRVAEIDRDAEGMAGLTAERVNAFLSRYLETPPQPGALRRLRQLALPLIFDASDDSINEQRRRVILGFCLDIGAAVVGHYPYEAHERFSAAEKALFLDLAESFGPLNAAQTT